jgi:uncharacterized protein YhdP
MKRVFLKFSLFLYRLVGSAIIFTAILISALYFILPIFVSTDEIKSEILKSLSLPVQFERIEWGVWGLSPTIVIHDAKLYQNKVERLTIELDWVTWLKDDKIKIKTVLLKKANLFGQYREDKIYLEDMPQHAVLFDQEASTEESPIHELILIDSHLVLRNELNQVFEAKHVDINLMNSTQEFFLDVKGRLPKESASFQFGLMITGTGKAAKSQLYISGEDIALSDLRFFFKDILISGEAHTLQLWLEGTWGDFNRFIAKGEIDSFEYFYENRKLNYDSISGAFGIEWKPQITEYYGFDIVVDSKEQGGSSRFYVGMPNGTENMSLLAKDFPLNRLDKIFTVFLADKPGLTDWWQKTQPRGMVEYMNLTLPNIEDADGHNIVNQLSGMSGELMVQELKINKNPFHMSIDKLSHLVCYYTKGLGKFEFKGQESEFQDSQYYPEGLRLENVFGTIWYWNQPSFKKIYFDNINATINKANLGYEGFWNKSTDTNLWETESQFFQENLEVNQLVTLTPNGLLDPGLRDWLEAALISGKLKQGRGVLRGNLKEFPYQKTSTGVVEIDVMLDDATLKYQQDWPELKKADGQVELEGPKLTVDTSDAEIANSKIESAQGVIENIYAPSPRLALDAKIKSTFTDAQTFVEHSPLKDTLGEKLAPLNLTGPMDLTLDLKIPLNINSPDKTEYRGLIDFEKSKVTMPKLDLTISALKGSIFFSPRGISGTNLSGNLFDTPARFTVISDVLAPDPRLKVSAKGQIEVAKLNTWFSLANSDLIRGKTNYTANLFLKHTAKSAEGELNINSDLSGISVNLPEPFYKKAAEKEPFDLHIQFSPQSIINMNLKYGERINVDYVLKTTNQSWASHSAHVVVGPKSAPVKIEEETDHPFDKTVFFSENPFSVEGNLETLDLSEWQALLSGSKNTSFSSNFFVKLKVKKLKAFGQDFENMTIQVSPNGLASREITILGEEIKGKVILPIGACTTSIKADFEYLNFPKNKENEQSKKENPLNAIKTKAGNCPIEVTVKKLDLNKKIIENAFLHLVPQETGFELKNIRAIAPNSILQASGFWTLTPKSQIDLKGIIQTKDIHDTLKSGGIDSTIHAAKGQIRFDLNWEKDLTDIDLSTVNGDVTVFLRNGYIKGAEPGIGRILSLLSVDNIVRRLQLDFSDVAKEGLSMDKLTASFHFSNGLMKTDDLVLDSPAARVELLGEADLNTKILEGTVKVMPKITGSLPVAAAIAVGNPAVGAAVWVADKVLGKTIQQITHYSYHLSGTIDKPKLSSGKPDEKK